MSDWIPFGLGVTCTVTLCGAAVAGLRSRLIYAEEEIDKLKKRIDWREAQGKAPELGPHRSAKPRECDPCMNPSHLHFDPQAAWEEIRPDRPEPTSAPSAGRIVER